MYPVIDPEVGFSIDDKYSVIRVAMKVAWYIPCLRWIKSGAIVRVVGGGKILVVGWVCRRGLCGCIFVKGVFLGYFVGIFLGRVNGCELWSSDGVFLRNFELTPAG